MLEVMLTGNLKILNNPGTGSGDGSILEINPEVFERLVSTDIANSDWFGWNLAVSGDGSIAVVGACKTSSGSAYVFTKQANGGYLQTQKLLASDAAGGDTFGVGLAISADGTTLVIGSCDDDDKGASSGSAYIFTKQTDGSYLQTQKLLASDGTYIDVFGWNAAVSGDGSIVVISAYYDDGYTGAAYIFTKQANGSYLETQKLVASDRAGNDLFGNSVVISKDGTVIVVGAHGNDDKGTDSGSAYVFTKQADGSYLESQKLLASDGAANDRFGLSVAISGNGSIVAVGAYGDDDQGTDSGSVYVFTKQANGSYLQTQKLVASDGVSKDYFGINVAVTPNSSCIVVGAYYVNDKSDYSRSAYIFTKQADGSYLQTQKLITTDRIPGVYHDFIGSSVAVSNTSVVLGAYNVYGQGAVYVY